MYRIAMDLLERSISKDDRGPLEIAVNGDLDGVAFVWIGSVPVGCGELFG